MVTIGPAGMNPFKKLCGITIKNINTTEAEILSIVVDEKKQIPPYF